MLAQQQNRLGLHNEGAGVRGELSGITRKSADLGGHTVCQQHSVAHINSHAVGVHDLLDLVHDHTAGCLDAQVLQHLHDVV